MLRFDRFQIIDRKNRLVLVRKKKNSDGDYIVAEGEVYKKK